MNQRQ